MAHIAAHVVHTFWRASSASPFCLKAITLFILSQNLETSLDIFAAVLLVAAMSS
jgi:hypothetical protein